MSNQARLVIIGGGIVGCSTAYHLTKLGRRDILVLDKGQLFENDSSTSDAPGGMVVLNHNKLMTQLAAYSNNFYAGLPPFSAERNNYNPVGSLELARTPERWTDLMRLQSAGKSYGVESHLLSPKETQARLIYIDPKEIKGSLFTPTSAVIAGSHICASLAREVEATGGAKFIANTTALNVEVQNGSVRAVLTNKPDLPRIECEQLLLCANFWSPAISEKLGVALPLPVAEYQYTINTPLVGLSKFDRTKKEDEVVYPTVRDLDCAMYYRQHWNNWGVGHYKRKLHMPHPDALKKSAAQPFTPKSLSVAWAEAQRLFPMLYGSERITSFNGLFACSADGFPIIGQSTVKGFWVAVASRITHAGGVGKSVAEWMTYGQTEWDMRQVSIDRFHTLQIA